MEQIVYFHTIASESSMMYDFLEEVRWPNIDYPVPGVVHCKVLPRNFAEMVFLEEVEK
jgi:hypothetical protein